jgi:hypothetical protein
MREIKMGLRSLHIRSRRRITALRWVKVYPVTSERVCPVRWAIVGTQSLSMEIIFADPLNSSDIPMSMTATKTKCFTDPDSVGMFPRSAKGCSVFEPARCAE